MFPVTVSCPHCGASLMDGDVAIDGHPSIRLDLMRDEELVELRLSSIYGSFRFVTPAETTGGEVTELFCPSCHRRLATDSSCAVCGAPLCILGLSVGGALFFCSRRGCKYHRAEAEDIERSLIGLTR